MVRKNYFLSLEYLQILFNFNILRLGFLKLQYNDGTHCKIWLQELTSSPTQNNYKTQYVAVNFLF